MKQYQTASDSKEKRYAAFAMWVDAYSAARRKEYAVARERFTYLRDFAAQLPDHGRQPGAPGEIAPTLEEEGAFQRAICTSAIDGPRAGEAELDAFLRRYPKSILVHGAVKRIARYHKGDVPKDAEALWKQAMAVQARGEKAQQRSASLCGPKCLAELLRRQGKKCGRGNAGPRDEDRRERHIAAGPIADREEAWPQSAGTGLDAGRLAKANAAADRAGVVRALRAGGGGDAGGNAGLGPARRKRRRGQTLHAGRRKVEAAVERGGAGNPVKRNSLAQHFGARGLEARFGRGRNG